MLRWTQVISTYFTVIICNTQKKALSGLWCWCHVLFEDCDWVQSESVDVRVNRYKWERDRNTDGELVHLSGEITLMLHFRTTVCKHHLNNSRWIAEKGQWGQRSYTDDKTGTANRFVRFTNHSQRLSLVQILKGWYISQTVVSVILCSIFR